MVQSDIILVRPWSAVAETKMSRTRAFSLVELLVVIGVLAVLAAILYPVFSSAKRKAAHVSWAESVRQVSLGNALYSGDYDDTFVVARYQPANDADPINDRTWVQSLLPYVRSFDLFLCPADTTRDPSMSVYDPDLVGGDTYSRFYAASMRADFGYNFTYLAPIIKLGGQWQSRPRAMSSVEDPSGTLLFADSAWQIVKGQPKGGGNYLVVPPCRFQRGLTGAVFDTFGLDFFQNSEVYTGGLGWSETLPGPQTGGIYAWFKDSVTVGMADGHVQRLPMARITRGCNVKRDWQGYVYDPSSYIWDLR